MKTRDLILWVENLMLMVHEAYEPLDTDWAHFEEISRKLKELDKLREQKNIEHNIYIDHVRNQQD